jgi:rhodanese-related sulfurtransferase
LSIDDVLAAARASIDRLQPGDAAAEVDAGALLVDTRCAELRDTDGIVPGSVHVPLSVLYWRLDPTSEHRDPALADLDRRVILICAHGYSSSIAAATLRALGFSSATDVIGGFEGWVEAGLPVSRLER